MKTGVPLLLLALLLAPGCDKTTTTPTSTTPIPYSDSHVFTGTLSAQGTSVQAFVVSTSATVNLLLASVTMTGTTTSVSLPLKLTLGSLTPDGANCTGATTVTATPALTSQISQSLIAGTYCVAIADGGSLTADVDFAVRVNQSANTTAVGQAGTDTFSSNLYPLGVATRTFAVSASGNVTVTLTSVTPAARLGMGVGIPNNNDCTLNTSVITSLGSGTEMSANADAGTYCVKIFDTGQLPGRVLFDVKIAHP